MGASRRRRRLWHRDSEAERIGKNMVTKKYMILGINTAVNLLRPGAKWEWTGGVGFTRWEDPRSQPSKEEVEETIEKIKAFEDSINTIWLPEQVAEAEEHEAQIELAMAS